MWLEPAHEFDMSSLKDGKWCRSWTYRWTDGYNEDFEWTLLLEDGVWWYICADGTRMPYRITEGKHFYNAAINHWYDIDTLTLPRSRWRTQWVELATVMLPRLNSILESGEWRARTVKQWSHHGGTRRYGDVGNRCMALIVDVALQLNLRLTGKRCWEVERRNMEHKADLLEAVMGLRELQPTSAWVAWGDLVDEICTVVHEAWSSPELVNVWDQTVLTHELLGRFGLDDFCAWHHQAAKSRSRVSAHAALQRRLRRHLVQLICRFL